MNSYLLSRSLGIFGPQTFQRAESDRLLHAIQACPNVIFDSSDAAAPLCDAMQHETRDCNTPKVWAHRAGVNSLVIDRFEGR